MKVSFLFVALSFALAASAAPHTSINQVREFNGSFGGNKGGSGGKQGGSFGGKGGNNNNGTESGNNQSAGGAAGANNGTAAGSSGNSNNSNAERRLGPTNIPNVIAKGFAQDGQGDNPTAGQVASLTSTNNFINFCATVPDLPITDGKQIPGGSCNPAPMGVIPSTENIPSAKFLQPPNGATIQANTAFEVVLNIRGINTGFFVNADANYLSAPNQIGSNGQINGHSHVVIEELSSLTQTDTTDPGTFAFFKGLNAAAEGGKLTAQVDKGLPAGFYRLSSLTTNGNHACITAPVAQHGALDDAIYFTVTDDGQPDEGSGALGGSNSTDAAGDGEAGKGVAGNDGADNAGDSTDSGAGNVGNSTASGAGNTGTGKTGGKGGFNNTGKGGADNTDKSNAGRKGQNGGRRSFNNFNRRFTISRI